MRGVLQYGANLSERERLKRLNNKYQMISEERRGGITDPQKHQLYTLGDLSKYRCEIRSDRQSEALQQSIIPKYHSECR